MQDLNPSGIILVSDSNNQCVQCFGGQVGECRLRFGIRGRSPGQFLLNQFSQKNRRTFKHNLVLVWFLNGLIHLIDKCLTPVWKGTELKLNQLWFSITNWIIQVRCNVRPAWPCFRTGTSRWPTTTTSASPSTSPTESSSTELVLENY